MKKIEMNVGERLAAMMVLPKEGNFALLRLIRDLSAKLGLSAEEMEKYDVKVAKDGSTKWNKTGLTPIIMEFEDKEIELIKTSLETLDKENSLAHIHYSIYEKFVIGADNDGKT